MHTVWEFLEDACTGKQISAMETSKCKESSLLWNYDMTRVNFPNKKNRQKRLLWHTLLLETCSSRTSSSPPPRGREGISLTSLFLTVLLLTVWLKQIKKESIKLKKSRLPFVALLLFSVQWLPRVHWTHSVSGCLEIKTLNLLCTFLRAGKCKSLNKLSVDNESPLFCWILIMDAQQKILHLFITKQQGLWFY